MKNEISNGFSIKPTILDRNIFLFAYTLLKYIFLKKIQSYHNTINHQLKEWIGYINKNIIKSKDEFISKDYTIQNLKNIILFMKKQNKNYCGDIIENILIFIFSKVFQSGKDNALYKYIFNNLSKLRENPQDFFVWIKNDKIAPYEFYNSENLFDIDGKENEFTNKDIKYKSVIYNFLRQILKEKYDLFSQNYSYDYKKYMLYLNHGNFYSHKISNLIYDKIKQNKKEQTILDKDIYINSIMNIVSNLSFQLSEENKPINQLILSFFSEIFIYYQNKNSPLLEYIFPEKDYATIPFTYDLRGACIEGRFSYAVLAPLRIGDFVSNIFLKQNNLRESGLFELGKLCVFNNNIKNIECDTCLLRSTYLDFLTYAMGAFDNNSVESLNFSYNYLRKDCGESIIKILKHFKNLRTLNLSSNEIHQGLSSVFIALKKLYRQNKSNIENLILNRCSLEDSSFYELSELLKCNYCKLKRIYFNSNPIPINFNFLKRLKKNKSLIEIYFNKAEINNSSVNDILKIISHSNIRILYLFKNNLNNFNDFLRIIYRTKIIKNQTDTNEDLIKNEDTHLINLDLSNNEFPIKNAEQIKLLKKIIEETSLYCLDICHIIYDLNPEKKKVDDINYKKAVDEFKTYLEKQKVNHEDVVHKILKYNVDKQRIEKDNNFENFFIEEDKIEKHMDQIYDNENSDQPVYLKKIAEQIIIDEEKKEDDYYKNRENIEKLANYLKYKNSNYNLKELETEKNKKKLNII